MLIKIKPKFNSGKTRGTWSLVIKNICYKGKVYPKLREHASQQHRTTKMKMKWVEQWVELSNDYTMCMIFTRMLIREFENVYCTCIHYMYNAMCMYFRLTVNNFLISREARYSSVITSVAPRSFRKLVNSSKLGLKKETINMCTAHTYTDTNNECMSFRLCSDASELHGPLSPSATYMYELLALKYACNATNLTHQTAFWQTSSEMNTRTIWTCANAV